MRVANEILYFKRKAMVGSNDARNGSVAFGGDMCQIFGQKKEGKQEIRASA